MIQVRFFLILKIFVLLTAVTSIHHKTWANDCSHGLGIFRCVEFVDNYDGDTLTVNIPRLHHFFGKKIPIRIRGIDTPERNSDNPCEKERALKAKQITHDFLVKALDIELHNIGRGKYFRIVADVIVDGKSLGDELVYRGLAVPYDGGEKPLVNWCR